jgi:hypothetical protein
MKKILSLEFDGVIHDYSAHEWIAAHIVSGAPVPGALAFIQEALKTFRVMIFSARSHQEGGIRAMQIWLREQAYTNAKHLDTPDLGWLLDVEWPVQKPPAFLTIDDRAIMFTGTWPAIADLVAFKPWNRL